MPEVGNRIEFRAVNPGAATTYTEDDVPDGAVGVGAAFAENAVVPYYAEAGAQHEQGRAKVVYGSPNGLEVVEVEESSSGGSKVVWEDGATVTVVVGPTARFLNGYDWVQVASAATVELAKQESDCIELTGTTDVADLGATRDFPVYWLRRPNGGGFTHGADLRCPGDVDLKPGPDDLVIAKRAGASGFDLYLIPLKTAAAPRVDCLALRYASATELTGALVQGRQLALPDGAGGYTSHTLTAAPTLDNSGLAADTLYYVYAYDNDGTVVLELSTTAPVDSYGLRVKTGATDRMLVGMVRTNGSSQFVDAPEQRFVRTWYNDPGVALEIGYGGSDVDVGNVSFAEWTGLTLQALTWGSEPIALATRIGFTASGASGISGYVQLFRDGGAMAGGYYTGSTSAGTGTITHVTDGATLRETEGYHYYRAAVSKAGADNMRIKSQHAQITGATGGSGH